MSHFFKAIVDVPSENKDPKKSNKTPSPKIFKKEENVEEDAEIEEEIEEKIVDEGIDSTFEDEGLLDNENEVTATKKEEEDEPRPENDVGSNPTSADEKIEKDEKTPKKPQPDSVSTDSGISMDSGISSGNSEGEVDTELVYEKPRHLNQ